MPSSVSYASSFRWQTINVVAQILLQLGFTSIMARKLTTLDFGIMGIVLVVMGFIEIFSQIGIGPALIQRKELRQEQVNGAFFLSLGLGVVFFLLIIIMAPGIERYFGCEEVGIARILRVIGVTFIIAGLSTVPRSLLIREMDFRKLFFAAVIGMSIGLYGVGITLAFLDYGVWAYVWALIVQNVALTLAYWLLTRPRIRSSWRWSDLSDMVRYGGGSTLFNLFNYAASKADVIMVGKYSGAHNAYESSCVERFASTGIYERAVWLMTLPVTVLGKLSDSVLFSGMSRMQDDLKGLRRVYYGGTYFISMLVFPGCVFLIFFAREVVLTLLGDQYTDAIPVARVLFIGVALRSLIKLTDAIVRALNAVYRASAIKAAFLGMVIVGTWWGLEAGLMGVARNLVVAILIQWVLMSALSLHLTKAKPGAIIGKMVPSVIVAGLTAVCALVPYFIIHACALPPLAGLVLAIALVLAGLLAIAWRAPWLFGKGQDHILVMLASRLPNRGIAGRMRKRFEEKS